MANNINLTAEICILIPCYNNIDGLIKSILSIVYHENRYLIVVVDDGSHQAVTKTELDKHLPLTVNIHIIRFDENQGIIKALNTGLDFIYTNYSPEYIARLDCGDTCHPDRFFKQVTYFQNCPSIDLLGSWCYFINGKTGEAYKYVTPTQHKFIKYSMYFRNVFIHPTVMWRVSSMKTFRYPENYPHAEDYGLFYDMVSKKHATIIDEFLVNCEINPQGISFQNRFEQLQSRLKVVQDYGKNKLWVTIGACKLILLMIMPYGFVYQIKKQLFKVNSVN
ncbi:MAG: glycosyltransferase [Chitinophagaceae bacterium]